MWFWRRGLWRCDSPIYAEKSKLCNCENRPFSIWNFLSLSWNFAQVFLWWRVVRWLQLKVSELNRWDAGMNRWWSLWLADLMSHVSQTVILTNRQRLVMANEIMVVIRIARNAVLTMTMAIALNGMWNIQIVGLEMNYYSEMVVLMRCDNIQ